MHGLGIRDGDRSVDWGRTSADYLAFRPGYPEAFFERLHALGVGVPGQAVLDLGTGTGNFALPLARRGAAVAGVDISPEQIGAARTRAMEAELPVEFRVAAAEATGLPAHRFDVVTASQCWPYFDKPRVLDEVRRVLRPDGLLVTAHVCWLPRRSFIARLSEELVLKFNPDWSGADYSGEIPAVPAWVPDDFELVGFFIDDVEETFCRESWRGRMRACRGIGASLPDHEVERFDREHEALLGAIAPTVFSIPHRIDCHIFRRREVH